MSQSTLKKHIVRLAQELGNRRFVLDGAFRLKRSIPFMDQFLEIQPGGRGLEGRFTCNLCWLFTTDGLSREDVYHHFVMLGLLSGGTDLWFRHEPKEDLEESWESFLRILYDYGLPFLDSNNDLSLMVTRYEKELANESGPPCSPASPLLFFGMDEGWRHYNLGFAYRALGNQEQFRHHLHRVISQYSAYPFEWVEKRRQACEAALLESRSV